MKKTLFQSAMTALFISALVQVSLAQRVHNEPSALARKNSNTQSTSVKKSDSTSPTITKANQNTAQVKTKKGTTAVQHQKPQNSHQAPTKMIVRKSDLDKMPAERANFIRNNPNKYEIK